VVITTDTSSILYSAPKSITGFFEDQALIDTLQIGSSIFKIHTELDSDRNLAYGRIVVEFPGKHFIYVRSNFSSQLEIERQEIQQENIIFLIEFLGFTLVVYILLHYVFTKRIAGLLLRIKTNAPKKSSPFFIDEIEILESRFRTILDDQKSSELKLEQLVKELQSRLLIQGSSEKDLHAQVQKNLETIIRAEKNQAVGNMVAGVAHEINTPIGNAVTASSFLHAEVRNLRDKIDTISRQDLDRILNTTLEATDIIEKSLMRAARLIKNFKKTAVENSLEEVNTFNVNETIQALLDSYMHRFKVESIQLEVELHEIKIRNYPGGLIQILTNLMENSILHGFLPDQQKMISIKLAPHENGVYLFYQDNGIGIPIEIQRSMYDPFFTTKKNDGGTGLGMHIIYKIVHDQMNGSIEYTGTTDTGAGFMLFFPNLPE
jgi:signal transduction histidine kinase